MNYMTLFGWSLGEQLKKKGIAKVQENESDVWKSEFREQAMTILNLKGSVTAEEVVTSIGNPPHHRNSIGAAMNSFAKENKLNATYEKSLHPAAHSRIIARWRRDFHES